MKRKRKREEEGEEERGRAGGRREEGLLKCVVNRWQHREEAFSRPFGGRRLWLLIMKKKE